MRHGESIWNKENRFTGWTDVDLSPQGIKEAQAAGQTLKREGYVFDFAFTSVLKRAIRTTWIVLDEMDQMWVPIANAWQLNERHYGALQGLNKKEMAQKYGEEQVFIWRRSYDVRPPELSVNNPGHPIKDIKYSAVPKRYLPSTECLKDTYGRAIPYWEAEISPKIKEGKTILVSAHGNSLRAIVKYLDGIPDDRISELNIPTGIPLVYELDKNLKAIKHYYLGDEKALAEKIKKVENQGKAK